ncbi:hypothetical protein [Cognatishimia maritima]|uniref:Peptidase propeptide and YPEB domain-containing protein n=1 Tax=Cognatishimia maritima TaxID=870908 RepID=A0A1M5T899_9RHOB|nr:hypothetical protein [Cognatishimia maritima]SHH46936.1 hypothetical protein SAMN04488044_2610 [Cognatishimia maritima]
MLKPVFATMNAALALLVLATALAAPALAHTGQQHKETLRDMLGLSHVQQLYRHVDVKRIDPLTGTAISLADLQNVGSAERTLDPKTALLSFQSVDEAPK